MEAQCRPEPRSTPIGGDPCPRPPECSVPGHPATTNSVVPSAFSYSTQSGSNARTTGGRTLPVLLYSTRFINRISSSIEFAAAHHRRHTGCSSSFAIITR
ncbi:hypothetical protein PgNI_10229 [Pyricularia grisea]|uniref:Uncharacterized protein n=1 Tax=Pyricularia grisea TaxID=148305 RepID=A0A6P8AZF1_PYRGI|nr:hypothetical protein PgNI_10229 [Pyricularia grisea]TLD07768.1 hypothetical protein PgNI_10229 [Pyricularia grisea]